MNMMKWKKRELQKKNYLGYGKGCRNYNRGIEAVFFCILFLCYFLIWTKEVRAENGDDALRLNLTAKICLSGERTTEDIKAGEFACYIISENPNVQIDTSLREVEAGGTVELGSFSFNGKGVYIFWIKQKQMGRGGYVYDQTQYRIIVSVSRDENGELQAKQWYMQGGDTRKEVVFYNICKESRQALAEGVLNVNLACNEEIKGSIREVTHKIILHNEGESTLRGVWSREYVPEYCGYISHTGDGVYGAVEGKEHVTFYLSSLRPGEEREFTITFRINPCRPVNWKEEAFFRYEILGEDVKPAVNDPVEPAESVSYGEIK